MFQIIEIEQGSPEWLKFRRSHIGASECPYVMGESPYKTPTELWEEKLGIIEPPKENFAMQRGKDLENPARNLFMEMTGFKVKPAVIKSNMYPWMIASLDGLSDDLKVIVEIKCPGEIDHEIAKGGFIPPKYVGQVQHQLACSGLDKLYYFSFRHGEGVIVEVTCDQEYTHNMIRVEKDFFNHMNNMTPPNHVSKDTRYISRASHEWNSEALRYKHADEESQALNKRLKELEEIKEASKVKLIEMANERDSEGNGLRLTKVVRKGNVDYTLIPELKNIKLDEYRKPSTVYFKIELVG